MSGEPVVVGDRVRILAVADMDKFAESIGAVGLVRNTWLIGRPSDDQYISVHVGTFYVPHVTLWTLLPAQGSMDAFQEAQSYEAGVVATSGIGGPWIPVSHSQTEAVRRLRATIVQANQRISIPEVRADVGLPAEDWKTRYEELEQTYQAFRKQVVTVGRREAIKEGWCAQFERVMEELGIEEEKTDHHIKVTMEVVVSAAERATDLDRGDVLAAVTEKLAARGNTAFVWEFTQEQPG